MKLDNQRRLTIPNFMREHVEIELGQYYYLIYKSNNNILIADNPKGKTIGQIKIDERYRFVIPSCIVNLFTEKEIVMYYEDDSFGMLIIDENI